MRQANDQIHVDAGKTEFARPAVDGVDQFLRLHPVDRLLHPFIEILHTQGETIEARLAQGDQVFPAQFARIGLAAHFRVRRDAESTLHHAHQAQDVLRLEVGRRAAAPVQLLHLATRVGQRRHPVHFLLQEAQVDAGLAVIARGDHVAAAVVAKRVAKGNVGVEGEAARGILGRTDFFDPVRLGETAVEIWGCGIGRIARPRLAVFFQEGGEQGHGGDSKGEGWDCKRGVGSGVRAGWSMVYDEIMPISSNIHHSHVS